MNKKTTNIEEITKEQAEKLLSLLNALKEKHNYTYNHSLRVSKYSMCIGEKLKLNKSDMRYLFLGSLLHDIGKLKIPNEILHKKTKLTDEEFEIMKKHSTYSAEILKEQGANSKLVQIVKGHHERYDGKGYPDGLKENKISLLSRIISVADSFDAITSTRCYSTKKNIDYVINELKSNSGTQFDPTIVNIFLKLLKEKGIER